MASDEEPYIPPGWSYNPATWGQRLPIVFLALVGFVIATYLSLYQWEVLDHVWEPFFKDAKGEKSGSAYILKDTWVSKYTEKYLIVPDAFLGALAYLADVIAGVIGGRARWRTMPWVVILFGILVGPLGVVSVMLVVFQPVLFGTFCTLCLASALVSGLMIGPAMDEFLASCQFLRRQVYLGHPFWKTFWGRTPYNDRPEPDEWTKTKPATA